MKVEEIGNDAGGEHVMQLQEGRVQAVEGSVRGCGGYRREREERETYEEGGDGPWVDAPRRQLISSLGPRAARQVKYDGNDE